jgi:acetyltransferase-like isoleucine patch superfamily enzyme
MANPLAVRIRNAIHRRLVESIRLYYNAVWGMRVGKGTRISLTAKLDRTNPRDLSIGEYTFLTFRSVVLTHDFVHRQHLPVRIGSYCFIGCGAVIMPGVTIGDHCIIGANTLVREDVPSHCLVVGNPGRIIRRDIVTVAWGMVPRPGETMPDGSTPPQPPGIAPDTARVTAPSTDPV